MIEGLLFIAGVAVGYYFGNEFDNWLDSWKNK